MCTEGEKFLTVSASVSVQGMNVEILSDNVHATIRNQRKFNCAAVCVKCTPKPVADHKIGITEQEKWNSLERS